MCTKEKHSILRILFRSSIESHALDLLYRSHRVDQAWLAVHMSERLALYGTLASLELVLQSVKKNLTSMSFPFAPASAPSWLPNAWRHSRTALQQLLWLANILDLCPTMARIRRPASGGEYGKALCRNWPCECSPTSVSEERRLTSLSH